MKILISDIDSKQNYYEKEEIINSINKFVQKGNLFIIATDKAINYIADTLALSNLETEYFICNDGGVIFDKYYNIIYRKDLRQELVRPIINMLEDDDNILETFIDTSHGFSKDISKSANGIVARPFDRLQSEILLNSIVLKYPEIHGHIGENWLVINDINASKLNALKYIISNYRLDENDVYVLGSEITDLELMEKYIGYNTKNCAEDIKKYSKGEVENIKELIEMLEKEEQESFDELY